LGLHPIRSRFPELLGHPSGSGMSSDCRTGSLSVDSKVMVRKPRLAGLSLEIDKVGKADDVLNAEGKLSQLSEVKGFAKDITYDDNRALTSLTYANGATASYGYDANNRLKDYQYTLRLSCV
jgi:YD repeat-containing protein